MELLEGGHFGDVNKYTADVQVSDSTVLRRKREIWGKELVGKTVNDTRTAGLTDMRFRFANTCTLNYVLQKKHPALTSNIDETAIMMGPGQFEALALLFNENASRALGHLGLSPGTEPCIESLIPRSIPVYHMISAAIESKFPTVTIIQFRAMEFDTVVMDEVRTIIAPPHCYVS